MSGRNILIIGGSGGIGSGFVAQLLPREDTSLLFATYRPSSYPPNLSPLLQQFPEKFNLLPVDVTREEDIEKAVLQIKTKVDKLHLVINCVGILHEGDLQPEKSLKHINPKNLMRYFEVNTIPTVLWAKHLLPLFKHPERTVFAILSAKVGSIEDNRLGGWYGYRASKAALNMLIKNIAIEYNRVAANTIVVALHPGTTNTRLSAPFQHSVPPEKLFSVEEATRKLLSIIEQLTTSSNGHFYSWDGSIIPW